MLPSKWVLAFLVATSFAVDECDLGELGLAEFADKVTVTNVSSQADAFVAVKFNHGQVTMLLGAGKSGTAIALAATAYTIKVVAPGDSGFSGYKDSLLELRDQLQDLTLTPEAPADQVANAVKDLWLVQSALQQLTESAVIQSCSGKLVTDVTSLVTVNLTETAGGTPVWALDCG